ncbi:MAG: transposase [bacterium]
MPLRSLSQSSFFDPEFAAPGCLVPGTMPWVLARHRRLLFPAWLFGGWRGSERGRNAWPSSVLMTMVLLRWAEEGMSRLASVRRAQTDLAWRAAMGLALDHMAPSERTLRDFEAFMRAPHPEVGRPRFHLFHEHVVRLCLEHKVVSEDAVWATDSTPMWCYGAVLDTVRLLGDGLRSLARRWAKARRAALASVANAWGLPWLLAPSTKGGLAIDWRDPEARADGLHRLASDVLRTIERIPRELSGARASLRKSLLKRCALLAQVVRDDLETDEAGRLVIVRRVTADRLVSFTDPEARHGRKTRSRTFNGFKIHVVGDVVSGLLASLTVTPGNQHDSRPAHRLIRRASALVGGLRQLLADTAYGAATFRRRVRVELGVELLAPPPPNTAPKTDRFGKEDFAVDFETGVATCPNGEAAASSKQVQANGGLCRKYKWPRQICDGCPLRSSCLGSGRRSREILLHPDEEEQRWSREQWSRPEVRRLYRVRSQCERLIDRVTRHGGRRARAWGLQAAQFQVHAIAAACNLKLLSRMLAAAPA